MVPKKPRRKSSKPRRRAPSGQSRRLGKRYDFSGAKPVATDDLPWWERTTLSREDLREIGQLLESRKALVRRLWGQFTHKRDIYKQIAEHFKQEGLGTPTIGDTAIQEGIRAPLFADLEDLWQLWNRIRDKFANKP